MGVSDLTGLGRPGWDPLRSRDGEGRSRVEATLSKSEGALRTSRLIRTIEAEIVPRLVLTRRVTPMSTPADVQASKLPDVFDVQELVRLLLAHEVGVASAYVETVRQRGSSLDGICLNLLAPAARELGLLWQEDECDFMQVTVGLCRLHQVLRELSPHFPVSTITPSREKRILLAALPGEQHTFGITVVGQFLLRAGWDVWQEFPSTDSDILEIIRHNWFAVAGLSVGNDTRLEELTQLIHSIRGCSSNRDLAVLVGGPVLVARPELARSMGADGTAADGEQAVQWADNQCRDASEHPTLTG